MDGFLNLLKPPGMSSHDAVATVRKILGQKKVGHGGTLDPAAAGVLPLALGRATRFIEYLAAADKEYYAEVKLGVSTDSGDLTGSIVAQRTGFAMPDRCDLTAVLAGFIGELRQRPPLASAVKLHGCPAYKLARREKSIDLPEREVTIGDITLTDWRENERVWQIRVVCGKGTYIRSLVADMGEKLKIPAVLSFLLRSRVGNFTIESAVTLEEVGKIKEKSVVAPERCLTHLPTYVLSANRRNAFVNGLPTTVREPLPALCSVYAAGEWLGVGAYDARTHLLRPKKIYAK